MYSSHSFLVSTVLALAVLLIVENTSSLNLGLRTVARKHKVVVQRPCICLM